MQAKYAVTITVPDESLITKSTVFDALFVRDEPADELIGHLLIQRITDAEDPEEDRYAAVVTMEEVRE